MTIITIGIDPGLSCGLAILRNGHALRVVQGPAAHCMAVLEEYLRFYAFDLDVDIEIAIERYTITPQTGRRTQQTSALEITGAVDLLAQRYQVPVIRQTISDVKKFVKNTMLRRLGLWFKPSDVDAPDADDAHDAIRHAVYRLAMTHASLFQSRLNGI